MKTPLQTAVTTAIVPVGGYGTRFLPASKSIPKEMFPVLDRPVVYYVVEELVRSGITKIVFVVGHRKQSVEDFFSLDETYENFLADHGKHAQVAELRHIATMANFSFVYTSPPYGNGAALHAAKHEIAPGEPFVITWGDEFVYTKGQPRIAQCIEAFAEFKKPTIAALRIPDPSERAHYGMAEISKIADRTDVFSLRRIVEKPAFGTEPSEFAAHGAYVLPYRVFDLLPSIAPGKDGELWLTDVINALAAEEPLIGRIIEDGTYLDCGTPQHYLQSQILLALSTAPYAEEFKKFLQKTLEK